MTGSDLCASAKPWDLQMQTVEVIYDEFYQQVREPESLKFDDNEQVFVLICHG